VESKDIYQQLANVMHDVFDDDAIVLTPDLTAAQVDGWDSLTHIRLMIAIERAFSVKFAAAEVGKLKNVGELVSLIAAKAA
jgi:acyl carrier protein